MATDITYPAASPPFPRAATSAGDLRRLAARAARDLESAPAPEILRWAAETFQSGFCVAASMGDGVVAHLAAGAVPGVDVLFVDTGYHFVETLGTRDAVDATLPVNVVTLTAPTSVRQQDERLGKDLWSVDPDRCCALRKVRPLRDGLASYAAWASGIRRDQTPRRAQVPVVGWDETSRKVTVAPLARWTRADVERYIGEHQVIVNPLRLDGYPSIGCWPCTRRVPLGEEDRSGRWPGFTKAECGIHS